MYSHGNQYAYEPSFASTTIGIITIILLCLVGLWMLAKAVNVNQAYENSVVFRLGKVSRLKEGGFYLTIPFIEWSARVDMRTVTTTFTGQEMITQDGLAITVDAVAWFKATDALKAVTTVENWKDALLQSSETAIRDVIGRHKMTEILKDRSPINTEMQTMLATTSTWGAVVEKIEIKNLDLPKDMQRAIAREAEAHREAAARIIKADGELQASQKLMEAAQTMASNPMAMQLRSLQTISEVGADKNSVVVLALPLDAIEGGKAGPLAAAGMSRLTA